MTIATLGDGNGAIRLELFLDTMIAGNGDRGYWVGFESPDPQAIPHIAEEFQRAGGAIGEPFGDEHNPIVGPNPGVEQWDDDDDVYFGIYSEPGVAFDMARSVHFIFDVLKSVPEYAGYLKLDDSSLDVALIDHEPDPPNDPVTRRQLIDARVGQGEYRRALERLWGNRCAVLGVMNGRVLRASHVKPWRLCNNQERLDPQNGLLLAAHIDALFDAGLITFAPDGRMIVADALSKEDRDRLALGKCLLHTPSPELNLYLEHHRTAFTARHGEVPPAG